MRRLSLFLLLMIAFSLPGYSQFWISFGWNEPHCRSCQWMADALHLTPKQARDYHKTVHKYGEKIEREARRDYRHWDKAAKKIYNLRVERDRKIQRILNPRQFDSYVYYVQERPQRIHDYRGWYENPRYAGRRHSPDWRRYEDQYFSFHWYKPPPPPRVAPKPRYEGRKPQGRKPQARERSRDDNRYDGRRR